MLRPLSFYLFLVAFLFWNEESSASAQTWGGSNGTWSAAANWNGGLPANDGTANITFSGHGAASVDAPWDISTLTIASGGYGTTIISGPSTLTLENGLTSSLTQGGFPESALTVNINLPTVQTWNITTSDLPVSGIISGAGGITKTGSGNLTLASGNTYSGGTIINGGSVWPTDDSSFGNANGALQIDGGTLLFKTVTYTDTSNLNFTRPMTLGDAGATIDVKRVLTLASAISGPGALTIARDASTPYIALMPSVILSGQNTFTGGLSLTNPYYVISPYQNWIVTASGTNQCLGNGDVTLSAGTSLSINSELNLGPGKKITLVANTTLILPNDTVDPANVISSASTQSIIELDTPTYTRALNLSAYGDGTLALGASTGVTAVYTSATLGAGSGIVYRLGGSPGTLVISGHDNVLTGNASLVTSGTVNLLNSNNFTGGTTVGSTVNLGADGALGSGTITLAGGELTALTATSLPNHVVVNSAGRLSGPLTINGTVDLGGGTPTLGVYGTSPVVFANVIGNGTLNLNSGKAVLQAANTFSALDLWEGGATVASESNLGGSSVPINFDGYSNSPTSSGTLETTASFTLLNPIQFNRPNNSYGNFQVDANTTLTLSETIPAGGLHKTGDGTLAFANTSSMIGNLNIYAGNVTSSGNSLSQALVQANVGGTFSGSGPISGLVLEGGRIVPGNGTGTISCGSLTVSSYHGPNNLQFEFTQHGSPTYANLTNSGNGLLVYPFLSSASSFNGNNFSIFFSTPSISVGDVFKGALFLQSTAAIASDYLSGVTFTYYVRSPSGTTTFIGQTYSVVSSSAVQQSWVAENGGQVCQFQIVSPVVSSVNFTQWAAQPGGFTSAQLADPAVSGPAATPQKDGVPNLLKYAFDINPGEPMTATDRAALPTFVVPTTGASAGDLTLTYRQNSTATGITNAVEVSTDLQTWTPVNKVTTPTAGSYMLQPTGTTDPATGDSYMQVDFKPSSVGQTLFIRMSVTQP